jgi:hypothetical protein
MELKNIIKDNFFDIEENILDMINKECIKVINIIELLPLIKKELMSFNDISKSIDTILPLLSQFNKTSHNKIAINTLTTLKEQLNRYKKEDNLLSEYKTIFECIEFDKKNIPTKANILNILYQSIYVIIFNNIEDISDIDIIVESIIKEVFILERLPKKEMKYTSIEIIKNNNIINISTSISKNCANSNYYYKF